jgi:hypothetical protein
MLTCRLDTKDDTPNGTNIVQLPVPARIAAPISPSECLSDVTERVEVAPTDNATTVIPAKEWSEPHSKEGPLVIPAMERLEFSSREGPLVIPAREQQESSSRDGSQFPLPAPVASTQRSRIQDQATAHPGSQLHSARAAKRADDDRSQKAAAVIPIKDGSESHSKEGPLVIPAREQPESSSRDGFQFPLPAPVACMNRNETRDQATAHPGFQLHSARAPEQADHDRSQK